MSILIIYAYPNHQGFNSQILKTVKNSLPKTNNVKTLDLYQDEFNPVLYFDNDNKRRDLKSDPSTEKYRNDIIWADHLIFIFPIWWSSMPAILKGYIDKVFASGFDYEFNGLMPTPLLPGKTANIITTHDTPNFYVKFFQQDYGMVLKNNF